MNNCKDCEYWDFKGCGSGPVCIFIQCNDLIAERRWVDLDAGNGIIDFKPGPDFGCVHFKKGE